MPPGGFKGGITLPGNRWSIGRDPQVRLDLGLRAHAHAEEHALYELMRHKDAARALAAHCSAVHRQIELLLRRLQHMGVREVGWLPTLATLQMSVADHFQEEEAVFFELATQVLGEAVLLMIETTYLNARLRFEAMQGNPPRRRLDAFA